MANINFHNYPYTDQNENKFLNLNGTFQTVNTENLTNITYNELVTLVNLSKLTPGKQYRITDYVTTTTQQNTQAAGHQFDIIVTALNTNTLSENASAIQHKEDTYFAKSKLNAWQLKYSIDNDKERFAWADPENGKGVIYRMIDEWNNDCPYDFKNIKFKRALTDGKYDPDKGEDVWCYTFTWIDEDGEAVDASVFCQNIAGDEGFVYGVHDNSMLPCIEYDFHPEEHSDKLAFAINDNVFISSYQFDDGIFYGIYGNHFGSSCYSNTFGNGCSRNTFGNECFSNTFGNHCSRNTFGNSCSRNTFGNSCSGKFGNDCSSNSFGDDCYHNSFGNGCFDNTFGNNCGNNTFGNKCYDNTFGNSCIDNTFGNMCFRNTFGNNCGNNTFGNKCFINTFGNNFLSISIGDNVNNVKVNKDYVQFILIENGNQKITITSNKTTSSSAYLQNFLIALGVNNSNNTKTISHNSVGDTFQTIYRPANSQIISV